MLHSNYLIIIHLLQNVNSRSACKWKWTPKNGDRRGGEDCLEWRSFFAVVCGGLQWQKRWLVVALALKRRWLQAAVLLSSLLCFPSLLLWFFLLCFFSFGLPTLFFFLFSSLPSLSCFFLVCPLPCLVPLFFFSSSLCLFSASVFIGREGRWKCPASVQSGDRAA